MRFRKRIFYHAVLRHQATQSGGNSFQEFFCSCMSAVHGGAFSRVRPSGAAGDYKCDGFILSSGTAFQCYGKEPDSQVRGDYIAAKIREDFEGAVASLGSLLKRWTFVHNIVRGLPPQALVQVAKMQAASPTIVLSVMDPELLERTILALPEHDVDDLLKLPYEELADYDGPLPDESIQRLLKHLAASSSAAKDVDLSAVPADKIEKNNLNELMARVIRDNAKYASQVGRFVTEDANLGFGDAVADALTNRYMELKSTISDPNDILEELFTFVLDGTLAPKQRDIKCAEAILAYFFDHCDIFEPVRAT